MFDFEYHTFSCVVSVVATILGMASPFLLQSIERIDTKYDSALLVHRFKHERGYKCFQVLLWASIPNVLLPPFLLASIDSVSIQYIIICFQMLLLLGLMLSVLMLTRLILTYHVPKDLLNNYKEHGAKKLILEIFDICRYASDHEESDTFNYGMGEIARLFREEVESNQESLINFSHDFSAIIGKIGLTVGDIRRSQSYLYQRNDITGIVYGDYNEKKLSEHVLKVMWGIIVRATDARNDNWLKQYWEYADWYYVRQSMQASVFERQDMKRFYEMHVMMGALYVWSGRYNMLNMIMTYSSSSPSGYVLIPGTFQRIFEMMERIDSQQPFYMQSHYPFYGLEGGVNTDAMLMRYVFRYLALLIIRLWSYDDYNINYADVYQLPSPDNVKIRINERKDDLCQLLSSAVSEWYSSGNIERVGLRHVPTENEVQVLLQRFRDEISNKNRELTTAPEVDPEKKEKLRADIIVANGRSDPQIPVDNRAMITADENTTDHVLEAKLQIEQEVITINYDVSFANLGSVMIELINNQLTEYYKRTLVHNSRNTDVWRIRHQDALKAVDRLGVQDGQYAVVLLGCTPDGMQTEEKALLHEDGRWYYRNMAVYCLSGYHQPAGMYVIKLSDLPYVEIVCPDAVTESLPCIDNYNYLYCNIGQLQTPPYEIILHQHVRIHERQTPSLYTYFHLILSPMSDTLDLERIKPLCQGDNSE